MYITGDCLLLTTNGWVPVTETIGECLTLPYSTYIEPMPISYQTSLRYTTEQLNVTTGYEPLNVCRVGIGLEQYGLYTGHDAQLVMMCVPTHGRYTTELGAAFIGSVKDLIDVPNIAPVTLNMLSQNAVHKQFTDNTSTHVQAVQGINYYMYNFIDVWNGKPNKTVTNTDIDLNFVLKTKLSWYKLYYMFERYTHNHVLPHWEYEDLRYDKTSIVRTYYLPLNDDDWLAQTLPVVRQCLLYAGVPLHFDGENVCISYYGIDKRAIDTLCTRDIKDVNNATRYMRASWRKFEGIDCYSKQFFNSIRNAAKALSFTKVGHGYNSNAMSRYSQIINISIPFIHKATFTDNYGLIQQCPFIPSTVSSIQKYTELDWYNIKPTQHCIVPVLAQNGLVYLIAN